MSAAPARKRIHRYRTHEAALIFPPMVGPEFDSLVQDMERRGQQKPIVLLKQGNSTLLLDGRNRMRACEQLGIEPITTYYDGTDPAGYVVSSNLHRRHLTESQRAMVGARLLELLEKERPPNEQKAAGGKKAGRGRPAAAPEPERKPAAKGAKKVVADSPQPKKRERKPALRDVAAQRVNVGGSAVSKAKKVQAHGCADLLAAVDAGVLKVELAATLVDRPKDEQTEIMRLIKEAPKKNPKAVVDAYDRAQVTDRIDAEASEMPGGPFRVVMVDFPWAYGKRSGDATQRGKTPYPTMSKDEIVAFARDKLAPLAHDDAILWLCITNAHLVEGDHVEVLKAAGFRGKTMLSWDKELMGIGDWLRGQTEHFIFAVKGRPVIKSGSKTTVLDSEDAIDDFAQQLWERNQQELKDRDSFVRVIGRGVKALLRGLGLVSPMINEKRREHSRKPEALYSFVEELCPGNKVELFSRTDRQGWTCWGGEAGSFEAELGL